jgi:hypothetical protein
MASELVNARQVALAAWPVCVCWCVLQYHHLTVILWGGVFFNAAFPPGSLGVLETMMRQMIGIKVVDCSCFSFNTAISSSKNLIIGT